MANEQDVWIEGKPVAYTVHPPQPPQYSFIWLDHQKYHADAQTIALLWQIKGWDRSPDQGVAHCAFDHAKQQGQVLDGPVSHHELAAHQHDRAPIDPDTVASREHAIDPGHSL